MPVRLRVEQSDSGSPAHRRVRLSFSPSALAKAARDSAVPTAAQTTTPDLFDATPSEATGVAPGRRKSSRSRVYSQRSSGGSKHGQHRASTGATDYVPPQVRLSIGAPVALPDSDTAFYYLLEHRTPKRAPSASPLLPLDKPGKTQLTIKQGKQQQALAGTQHKDGGLPDAHGPTTNDKSQSAKEQNANKENLLMGLHIPRFNIIEARHKSCSELELI
ncbi:hypothetical protein ABBQ32_006964 [Trebouxia sp. C0010 RCD-2024]